MSGRTIGAAVGTTIGFFFGVPQLGFQLGALAGGIIKPDVVQGRKLDPPQTLQVQLGSPICKAYGRPPPFAGGLLDGEDEPRIIHKKVKSSGGKGGPVVKEDHYLLTYAILVGEEISGYLRIWRNGVLVLDRRQAADIPGYSTNPTNVYDYLKTAATKNTSTSGKITLYNGTQTQLPDPALEAIHGVGNTPAYRGRAYIVVVDDDVTDTGGTVPQWTFEVIGKDGATVVADASIVPTPDYRWPLDDAVAGGTAIETIQGKDGVYSATGIASGAPLTKTSSGSMKMTSINAYMLADYPADTFIAHANTVWSAAITVQLDGVDQGTVLRNFLAYWQSEQFGYNKLLLSDAASTDYLPTVSYTQASTTAYGISGTNLMAFNKTYRICGTRNGAELKLYVNGKLVASSSAAPGSDDRTGVRIAVGGYAYPSSYGWTGYAENACLWVSKVLTAEQVAEDYLGLDLLDMPDADGVYWDRLERRFRNYTQNNFSYSVTKPTLQSIVEDIAGPLRCGIPAGKFSASDLAGIEVPGYLIGQQVPGLDLMGPLQQAYFWDYASYDGKLHSRLRGGAVVRTITEDDLLDTGDDDPDTTPQQREFPLKVSVTTQDPAAEYAAVPQTSLRTSTTVKAANEVNITLLIPLPADDAMQIAEKIHNVLWTEAEGELTLSLPEEHSDLIPTDSIYYPDTSRRWYITRINEADGEIKVEAKLERVADLTSTATGNAPDPAQLPSQQLAGPTILTAMNLPPQAGDDNGFGLYVALQGVLPGWPGGSVYVSINGGTSYYRAVDVPQASIQGELTANEPGGTPSEPITVRLYDGDDELSAATTAEVATGTNQAAIVQTDGSIEIIGFETPTLNVDDDYELTDTSRALQGTTQLSLVEGDRFVLLDTTYFIPLDPSLAGTTIYLRGVTLGTAIDANPVQTIVFDPPEIVWDGGEVVP